ncbi:MAG TPA: glycosyltransferase family 2 protein [Opitutus sp.]|nr:glycosyltransferase family 2 protein [Opitutus sp.]
MSNPGYSAYVPCFNAAATLRAAVESILAQTVPPAEVLVIDDGSERDPSPVLAGLPARLLRLERNLGRGAARSRAMAAVNGELVLCCDATNVLPPEFAQCAMKWFSDERVAAACGPLRDPAPQGAVARWRARHLFKEGMRPARVTHRAVLATYGAMARRSAIAGVGGFDPTLRHSEDADLSGRLSAAGWNVVFDPALATICNVRNTCGEVLERYWRWTAGKDEAFTLKAFARTAWFAWRTLAVGDLARGDAGAAGISLVLPFYLAATAARRRLSGERQRPQPAGRR